MTPDLTTLELEPAVRALRLEFWTLFTEINNIRRDDPSYVRYRSEYCNNPDGFVRRWDDNHNPITRTRGNGPVRSVRSTRRDEVRPSGRILGEPF